MPKIREYKFCHCGAKANAKQDACPHMREARDYDQRMRVKAEAMARRRFDANAKLRI